MRSGLCTVVILLLVVCLSGAALWAAHTWSIETVDADNGAGFSCLALDSSGYPHVAYSNYVEVGGEYGYELRYVRSDGATWIPASPDDRTVDGSTNQLAYCNSIALNSSNHPHIAYSDTTADDLKYAEWTGATWNVQTIVDSADRVGMECSLALNPAGQPHIAYRDSTNQHLKDAEWTGGWSFARTIPIDASRPSLRLDSGGHPHIAYTDSAGSLYYISWDGESSNWKAPEEVDGSGPDAHPCLALGPGDLPCIAYADRSSRYVKHAQWNATSEKRDVEVADPVGRVTATDAIRLALTAAGEPQITFTDGRIFPVDHTDLLYASATGPLAVRWPR